MPNNHFWQFRNTAETGTDEAELLLYGEIASEESWWRDTVTPLDFKRELNALGNVRSIQVRIYSLGGDVFAANAIYSNLREHPAKIRVRIDGIAASAATVIAMAGDEITIDPTGVFMIHDPSVSIWGHYNSTEMDELQKRLAIAKKTIMEAYINKTGLSEEDISALMTAETWMTGREAVDRGFCTNLVLAGGTESREAVTNKIGAVDIRNSVSAHQYKNVPKSVLEKVGTVMDKTNTEEEETMADQITTVEGLRKAYSNLVEEIENAAVLAERRRLQQIDDVLEGEDLTGAEEVVRNAKYGEKPMNADALAAQMWRAQKEARKNGGAQNTGAQNNGYLAARAKDAQDSGVNGIPAAASPADNKAADRKEQDEHDDAVIAAALGLETK